MARVRLIARLDIKGPNLVKGIHLEGLRVMGDPQAHARRYYEEGADELIYMDIVASLYQRNSLHEIVSRTAREVFIPLTVGGGIRSVDDVRALLRAGADKVAINTAAVQRPELVSEIARAFGSQCIVGSIEAKRRREGGWEALTDNGREHTGLDAIEWSRELMRLGVGEIMVTSVDQEGTRRGFDVELVRAVAKGATVPLIASGGMGNIDHLLSVCVEGGADAVAMADVLHYRRADLRDIRFEIRQRGVDVREAAGFAKGIRAISS